MASPFETGSMAQLFATPIWTFKPANAAALVERVQKRLYELREEDPRWRADTAAAIWQSRPDLYDDPELAGLVSLIHEAARAALKLLEMDCELVITGLWGNIGRHGDSLHDHTHPNNFLSGVLYVAVPQGGAATSFKDPRPQTRILRPRVLRDNPFNSTEFQYRGTPGTMLLWPAWLEHGVGPNASNADRITVAFNLMIRGPLGSKELLAYSEV